MHNNIRAKHLQIINQIFDLEKKLNKLETTGSTLRNIKRIKDLFEEINLQTHDILGEPYKETRTDCEATISGNGTENLVISEVIKPLIIENIDGRPTILQKAVVIVEEFK